MVLFFSKFKRNIFGGKVSEHGPSVLPATDFWDLLIFIEIPEKQYNRLFIEYNIAEYYIIYREASRDG